VARRASGREQPPNGLFRRRRCARFSDLTKLYQVETVPLDGPRPPSDLGRLAQAWGRLADAGAHGDDVLADVLLVLLTTVPSARTEAVPVSPLGPVAAPFRPTAAHPRAFQGTKCQPPKATSALRGDLRPLLCSTARVRSLLQLLWHSKSEALRRLKKLGFQPAGLARLARHDSPPPEPYVVFHHDDAPALPRLAPTFVERILPSLSGASWSLVRQVVAAYHRLELEEDEVLYGLVARLLQTSRGTAPAWLDALETQPRERRLPFLTLVLETGAAGSAVCVASNVLADLAHAPAERYERWAYVVLDSIRRSINPRYLAAGIHWAAEYAPDAFFRDVLNVPGFRESTATRIEAVLPASWGGHELIGIWETCGVMPEFCRYLETNDWDGYTPGQRQYLLRLFTDMRWDQNGAMSADRWRALAHSLPQLERRVREVPPAYTDQYLNDLGSVLSGWPKPQDVRARLPLLIDLLARVNQSPFDPDGNAASALGNLLKLPDVLRSRILAAPDTGFVALDRACRRANAATLIAWGLSTLVDGLPQLVADAFESATTPLLRTARQLGVLSWPARAQLVARCARWPLFDKDLQVRSLDDIAKVIDAARVAEASAVVPRAYREHVAGRRRLSPGQIARHEEKVRRALPACRLAVVRSEIDAHLASALTRTAPDREVLSALALLQNAEKNRRGLRRFLRAYLDGDSHYLLRHPATRDWSRRHPRIDLAVWTRGLDRRIRPPQGGELRIRLEQDPLEVLKVGTYVGSCLGLGGSFAFSAAAVALDVNKQVLYARDDQGSVVARQLVAISDSDELVSFSVYPESAPQWLRRAFDEYDTELAAALGIPRADPTKEYVVEYVLSQDWWDDGAWDPDDGR
jgi:hypothetical protein